MIFLQRAKNGQTHSEDDKHCSFLVFVFLLKRFMIAFVSCVCVILLLVFAFECNMAHSVQRHSPRCSDASYSQFMTDCFLIVRCTFFDIFHSDHARHDVHCAYCTNGSIRQYRMNTTPTTTLCQSMVWLQWQLQLLFHYALVTFTIWLQLVDNSFALIFFCVLLLTFLTRLSERLDNNWLA